ncbi:MAG: hypothetical protein PHE25_01610, partial [Candidatus Gracilibacteria bacterium]|nr:hypothetical protein [Candidatus Gracilibacteria bacterium]
MVKYNKIDYSCLDNIVYFNRKNDLFLDVTINDFFKIDKGSCNIGKIYFINTDFLLSKILHSGNIKIYNKIISSIKYKIDYLNKFNIDVVFDYLPVRFFGKKYIKNNYFFSRFMDKKALSNFLNKGSLRLRKYGISIQVIIFRLYFLDDLFMSLKEQSLKVDEIFLFVNLEQKY